MKKYLKFFVSIIFGFISLFLINNNALATSNDRIEDYTIEGYNIDMVVNENNTFDITEKITFLFTKPTHGIEKQIPLINTIDREDGTTSRSRAKITNLKVNKNFTEKDKYGYKILKIGDKNVEVNGYQTYIIKYTYNIGKDMLKSADELYYNMIGSIGTTIDNVSFKITMPKEFDSSTLTFYNGKYKMTNGSNVTYNVDGNVITGQLNSMLYGGNFIVRLTLPEGYFVGANINIDWASLGIVILCVASIIGVYMLWRKYGKDNKIVETVEFYPPKGYNSAEVGCLYSGEASTEDVVSLLIYLANEGYLEVEETKNTTLSTTSKGFKITKLKEYNGNNEAERIFFNGLFEKGNIVRDSDLYDSFYITIEKVMTQLLQTRNKIFEKSGPNKRIWIILNSIIIIILIFIKISIETDVLFTITLCGRMLWGLFILLMPIIVIHLLISGSKRKAGSIIVGALVYIPLLVYAFICIMRGSVSLFEMGLNELAIIYLIGIITVIILAIFAIFMGKITKYGEVILGKIRGFRKFLETAEKDRIESLVHKNPKYFYNILPYAYALEVSTSWINQFEIIAMKDLNRDTSNTTFDFLTSNDSIFDNMNTVQTVMTSSPSRRSSRGNSSSGRSSSSGGGFSGGRGGSSGGGYGGGSISSW